MQIRSISLEEVAFIPWTALKVRPDSGKCVLGAFDTDGNLVAALQYRRTSEVCSGWTFSSLEVAEPAKGQGISKALLGCFFGLLRENSIASLNVTVYTDQGSSRLRPSLTKLASLGNIELIEDCDDPFYR